MLWPSTPLCCTLSFTVHQFVLQCGFNSSLVLTWANDSSIASLLVCDTMLFVITRHLTACTRAQNFWWPLMHLLVTIQWLSFALPSDSVRWQCVWRDLICHHLVCCRVATGASSTWKEQACHSKFEQRIIFQCKPVQTLQALEAWKRARALSCDRMACFYVWSPNRFAPTFWSNFAGCMRFCP